MTRITLKCLELLGRLPLAWIRVLGVVLGWVLYGAVASRRRVVWTNLRLCFPHWTEAQIRRCATRTFVHFAQSWLDRGWLWHAPVNVIESRLRLTGAAHVFEGNVPLVLFAPHFVGLDAGWTGLTQQVGRKFNTIYTDQANKDADAWILKGRRRFGTPGLFGRADGVKPIIAGLKRAEPLYLLPDMNFGPHESVWVPFYGVPAATVPSLSRFARLGRAQVVPVVTRITRQGYDIQILEPWSNFPTDDLQADAALMNQRLEGYIDAMPDQYYWVHKRFKDQPPGLTPPY